jgi:Staphylococcal nuclease homologue
LLFQRNIAFLVIIVGIFGSLLMPVLSIDFAFATSDGEGGDTGGGGNNGGGDNGEGGGVGDEPDPEPELEPEPEPSPDPGIVPGPEPLVDPCLENPEAEGCGSEPPVDPCIENPNAEGCEPDPGLVGPTPQPMPPYEGCLLDPTLPECTPPPGGKCPPGTLMNGYGQCYPDKPCPPGYARADNDESGACLPLNTPTPTPTPGGNCDPSYPGSCIPRFPPDLDCGDAGVPDNVKVVQPDPHKLDNDKDGVGCENGEGGSSSGRSNNNNDDGHSTSTNECQGQADCFRGMVTEIVDGDTIDINNVRVRLALVNTPERGDNGYTEAIDFVESVCSVGTTSLVDEDDGQKEGSFDRLIGLVYCGNDNINNKKSLNELLLERGYAVIYQDFCGISEFSSAGWAQSRGC